MKKSVDWKVHTSNLFQEVLTCHGASILFRPLQILASILAEVGERASELNDPELNALMCRLTIYSIADPHSPDYDPETVREICDQARQISVEATSGYIDEVAIP